MTGSVGHVVVLQCRAGGGQGSPIGLVQGSLFLGLRLQRVGVRLPRVGVGQISLFVRFQPVPGHPNQSPKQGDGEQREQQRGTTRLEESG